MGWPRAVLLKERRCENPCVMLIVCVWPVVSIEFFITHTSVGFCEHS